MSNSTDRLRVRRLLQAMTAETCHTYPQAKLAEVWQHVDGAMQILNDTRVLTYDERMTIVAEEYHVCHASEGKHNEQA